MTPKNIPASTKTRQQWDLLNGLSELCLAVESLEVEVEQLKAEIKKLQK